MKNTSFTSLATPLFNRVFWITVLLVLALTVYTRLYRLDEIPSGITWDEAAIGYNGYSIITTRRDEWLVKLPVSFRSFGDYKAPLAIYINGFFTYMLGLNEWSVRLPFALAGIAFVGSMGLLTFEVTRGSKHQLEAVVTAMLLAATSPWHLHYSRVGFEAGIALTCITIATSLLLRVNYLWENAQSSPTESKSSQALLALAGVLAVLSLYAYHSAKITLPLLMVYLLVLMWRQLISHWKYVLVVITACLFLMYPLVNDTINGEGATRANVLVFSQQSGFLELSGTILENFLKHFTIDFLLKGIVDSARHGAGKWGVLSPITVLLIIAGLAFAVIKRDVVNRNRLLFFTGALLVLFGILPAALSAEVVPHSNRSLLALPGFILLAVGGMMALLTSSEKLGKLVYRLIIGVVVLLELLFFVSFWQHYTTVFAATSSSAFQAGYVQAMKIAYQYEKGLNGKPEVDKILVSTEYGQPYIYALFVKNPSPIAYQGGTLYKYEFNDHISASDLDRNNTLILATPNSNLPEDKAISIIKGSEGETRFLIFYTGLR